MRVVIAAIGHAKKGPELELYHHYIKRLPWQIILKEHEAKSSLPVTQRKESECAWLMETAASCDRIIALDETGKDLGSEAFANQIQQWQSQSHSSIAFMIGGADGLTDAARKKAHLILNFGRLTWPHMLMRGLLAEQLYRSYSILTNHPYHRA